MTNISIFLKSFLFTSLLVLILSHQALAAKKQRNWRIGLGRMINTVYYQKKEIQIRLKFQQTVQDNYTVLLLC